MHGKKTGTGDTGGVFFEATSFFRCVKGKPTKKPRFICGPSKDTPNTGLCKYKQHSAVDGQNPL